jgi:60 kDa SS-A/Ro ribonucleoprotein
MARTNTARVNTLRTNEGAPAHPASANPMNALRRSVMSCMLWESEFYEDGVAIADRIMANANAVSLNELARVAYDARHVYHLRHVPLLLLVVLAKRGSGHKSEGGGVAKVVADIVSRADEMAELISLYQKFNPDKMIPAAMRRGLAQAMTKFDEYALAKYDRKGSVSLRDVFRMVRPKPIGAQQAALWGRAVTGELKTPDTWETELSAGKDKKATFERLINEGKLGYLALLRNLRNMDQAGCDPALVESAIALRKGASRVLPFRYVAAARAAPRFEKALDIALFATISELPELPGETFVLVDVSGSMEVKLSQKSDMTRMDAGATLAAILNCERMRVFSFTDKITEVPARRGMAGIDAVIKSQPHGSTMLGAAVSVLNKFPHDRLIVITDEQSHDPVPSPVAKHAYMINVASAKNGVGYGRWTHLDGFSENIIRFIVENERQD